jgi:hypothetical protein
MEKERRVGEIVTIIWLPGKEQDGHWEERIKIH